MIIYTAFDIKPTKQDLKRLENRGSKGDPKWYLDGKFVGIGETNAIKRLKEKLFTEYKAKRGK